MGILGSKAKNEPTATSDVNGQEREDLINNKLAQLVLFGAE